MAAAFRCDSIFDSALQAVRALLGDEGAVTESNLLAYLGIIEQRTNELLQVWRRAWQRPSCCLPMCSACNLRMGAGICCSASRG